jgi:hypothetical protein
MLAHAWSVLCDRCMFDRDSDAISLDTVERITVRQADRDAAMFVPCRLQVVSLWYRADPAWGGHHHARLSVCSPAGEALARFPIDVDLSTVDRFRSRCILEGLLVERGGRHAFVVEIVDGPRPIEVARIPFEIVVDAG